MKTITMNISVAELSDIAEVLELQSKYHIASINEEDKPSGFVTTAFTTDQLTALIQVESGLFIARIEGRLVAYAMAASWGFWSQWPMFAHMIKELHKLEFLGQQLGIMNSYQYGPVCVEKAVRGTGVLE